MILRGLVRRPGTTIYRAGSPSPLGRTIDFCRSDTFGLVFTGVLRPAFAATPVFLGCAGAGRAKFAAFLRYLDCTALPDGRSDGTNPYLSPQRSPWKIIDFTTGPIAPAEARCCWAIWEAEAKAKVARRRQKVEAKAKAELKAEERSVHRRDDHASQKYRAMHKTEYRAKILGMMTKIAGALA